MNRVVVKKSFKSHGKLFEISTRLWRVLLVFVIIPVAVLLYGPYYLWKEGEAGEAFVAALALAFLPWEYEDEEG